MENKPLEQTTVANKDAFNMALWLLKKRDFDTVVAMVSGEMPWLAPLDVVGVVDMARARLKEGAK